MLVSTYNKVDQLYIYIYTFFYGFHFHLGPTEPWVELPVYRHRFSWVTYFMHSMSISQTPFAPWYPYGCSPHLCLYFCFANKIIYPNFFNSIYMYYHTVFFSFWLTSLCMTDSRSTYISTNDPISFLFMAIIRLYICAAFLYPLLCLWTFR